MTPTVQRAYRACLYCRSRKSKCEFDTSQPAWSEHDPQCRRCIREGRHCVLATGARQRRRRTLSTSQHSAEPQSPSHSWTVAAEANASSSGLSTTDQVVSTNGQASIISPAERTIVDGQLQNPGDALNLLARVANSTAENQSTSTQNLSSGILIPAVSSVLLAQQASSHGPSFDSSSDPTPRASKASLFQKLGLPLDDAKALLIRYSENYHPFFPIANNAILDPDNINASSIEEPHLMAAILTIATKHDDGSQKIHDACCAHLTGLIASVVTTGPTNVEAVEALLVLAEWTPQRFQSSSNVGTGEEDRAAWMHVGLAVRLAYLQGLDATSFEKDSHDQSQANKRRRVAWAACYMSDRLISTRVGKAFWSRGPGPSSTYGFEDYDPFKIQGSSSDDHARIFQANLDLTQLFSNAHDILYASLPHRDRLFQTGEYAKYIDDFRNVLANWQAKWGSLCCSNNIKCGLLMSYDYLRLYITAFAYQATLSRIRSHSTQDSTSLRCLARNVAGTADARFIYEATSAAKSLLTTFNTSIHPTDCLRYMPMRYYLYIIYAAVFLYKARATGVLGEGIHHEELEKMIYQTIARLQQSSITAEDPGSRYSNLLALLWGKVMTRNASRMTTAKQSRRASPKPSGQSESSAVDVITNESQSTSSMKRTHSDTASRARPRSTHHRKPSHPADQAPLHSSTHTRLSNHTTSAHVIKPQMPLSPPTPTTSHYQPHSQSFISTHPSDPTQVNMTTKPVPAQPLPPVGAFSWRDLESVGQYATASATAIGTGPGASQAQYHQQQDFTSATAPATQSHWAIPAGAHSPASPQMSSIPLSLDMGVDGVSAPLGWDEAANVTDLKLVGTLFPDIDQWAWQHNPF